MLFTGANGPNGQELNLAATKKRFLAINRERLRRAQETLRWKQKAFLDLLPLLFHINHPLLPGYVSKQTPSGIPLYHPSRRGLEAARKMARSFSYKKRALQSYAIESVFIMGSIGTVAHSPESDFDVWVCHTSDLNSSQLQELGTKCEAIERWCAELGLEVHFFLMDARKFRKGAVTELSSESSGSTQHHLLLEEFYRTGVLVAGRFPIWWLVPPEGEGNYEEFVNYLIHQRFVVETEVIDFGGLSKVPAEEFFGAALWQVYKGIDSPYKSVLKILLMEIYASEYPNSQLLSLKYKGMVFDGVVDINALDPYVILLSRLESYLIGRNEPERLDLVRRCFYFKTNVQLSKERLSRDQDWQFDYLKELCENWQWDAGTIYSLDKRNSWKIHRVLAERKILVEELTNSYLSLSGFARNHTQLTRISQHDLNVLGRKLYAAFERKVGKVELVNRGVSRDVVESKLILQQSYTRDGEEVWSLCNELPPEADNHGAQKKHAQIPLQTIRRGRSALELLAWCHFNRLIGHGTVISLDLKNSSLNIKEVKAILDDLERQFPGGSFPKAQTSDYDQSPSILGGCIFTNVGMDPLLEHSRRGTDIVSDRTDVLNYSGFSYNLANTFDVIVISSWQEILCYRYTGIEGLLSSLCEYLRWNKSADSATPCEIKSYSYASGHARSIAARIEALYQDVRAAFYRGNTLRKMRYVLEVRQRFYILFNDNDCIDFRLEENEEKLFEALAESHNEFVAMRLDRYALEKTILGRVLNKNRPGALQLFYETQGGNAHIYVLDENGSLHHQITPFYEDLTLINQFSLFFYSIIKRQGFQQEGEANSRVKELEFCRVKRVVGDKCMFERKVLNKENLTSKYFHVQVIGDVVDNKPVFTIYCEGKEFSYIDHGATLFLEVARFVLSQRKANEKYPIFITDLDMSPALLGERLDNYVPVVDYLQYKKRIEDKLNAALRNL